MDAKLIVAIIGIITSATIAIGIAYFVNLRLKGKRLSHEILAYVPLLTATESIRDELQISYKGTPVKNIRLFNVKIINDGYEPITRNDYEKPISFVFADEAVVLSAEIVSLNPKNLETSITFEANKISINPTLLNSKDSIEIKAIISSYETQMNIDARIIGVKDIKPVQLRIIKSIYYSYGSLIIVMLSGSILSFFLPQPISLIVLMITVIAVIFMAIEAIDFITKFRGLDKRNKPT